MASFRDHYSRSRISTLLKFLAAACVFLYFCSIYSWLPVSGNNNKGFYISPNYVPENRTIPAEDRAIVVAKTRNENIDWLLPFCQDYGCTPFVYSMEPDPEEGLLVPATTQGHEAAAYLTYIIQYYDSLPPYNIFVHANDDQWHNELFGPKTSTALRFLRYDSVDANGFVNLRCTGIPGCPNTLVPIHREPVDDEYAYVNDAFFQLYSHLLQVPMDQVPERVGHLCCGQFVLTRERIRARPREDYERILNWAANTDFTDSYGIGWTIEKIWHVLFGMEPVHCPRLEQCRCDNYGWCGPLPSGEILTPIMP
ncbi:hypothetical protein PISL3812_09086 [Talaromyces islandicus]|uniref:Uncharacterized protein n=1 Tax=Talaromyces islandicus TaxID=28573 RepID=A0A0U1MAE2_TALIS|nr:hypothetical protein PISL3812_09086 [Talaromyces islandicus]